MRAPEGWRFFYFRDRPHAGHVHVTIATQSQYKLHDGALGASSETSLLCGVAVRAPGDPHVYAAARNKAIGYARQFAEHNFVHMGPWYPAHQGLPRAFLIAPTQWSELLRVLRYAEMLGLFGDKKRLARKQLEAMFNCARFIDLTDPNALKLAPAWYPPEFWAPAKKPQRRSASVVTPAQIVSHVAIDPDATQLGEPDPITIDVPVWESGPAVAPEMLPTSAQVFTGEKAYDVSVAPKYQDDGSAPDFGDILF
jgi:hypothetical protein